MRRDRDALDDLLRRKSGGQITEQEYQRLKKELVKPPRFRGGRKVKPAGVKA